MTIYDEALKDLENLVSTTCDGNKLLARTKLALERAKKVEELLGLIKERARIDNDLSMAETKHDRDVIRVLWWENNVKIQALEEEMK